MKKIFTLLAAGLLLFCSCSNKAKEDIVSIHTPYGVIKVKLYEKTPQHRDNFIKIVESGFYDSTLFHRVIRGFMIQAGDPDSKNAQPGQLLGESDTNYKIPAEFVDDYLNPFCSYPDLN